MNRYSISVFAAVCGCLTMGFVPSVEAETPQEVVKSIETERDKLDLEVQAKFEAIVAATDAEIQAGKMTREAAELVKRQLYDLRFELRWLDTYNITGLENKDPATVSPRNKAEQEFSAAVKARHVFRTEKLNQVRDSSTQSILSTWRKAEREEDLNDAMELLREIDRVLPKTVDTATLRPGFPPGRNFPGPMSNAEPGRPSDRVISIVQELSQLLSASQRFLAAVANGDPSQISNTLAQLRGVGSSYTYRATVITSAEIDQWRMRFAEKATAEVNALQKQADNLIATSPTSKDIRSIAEKLQSAVQRAQALGGTTGLENNGKSPREVLVAWSRVLEKMETGDWRNVQREIAAVGDAPDWLSAEARKGFYAKLKEAGEARAGAEKTARAQTDKQIREQLAKVTDSASALALAEALPIDSDSRFDGARERLAALQADLRRLAALWDAPPGTVSSLELLRDSGSQHPWQAELRKLRSKILRESVAHASNSPELLTAPLDALSLETAIRKLGATLKEKQDWKRLHDLLANARADGGRDWEQSDELRGVKAFLTGQNLERAEQFREAVQSYRSVLSCVGELVPVEATAERLKAITREHPEAVAPAPRPNPSSSPTPRTSGEAVQGIPGLVPIVK